MKTKKISQLPFKFKVDTTLVKSSVGDISFSTLNRSFFKTFQINESINVGEPPMMMFLQDRTRSHEAGFYLAHYNTAQLIGGTEVLNNVLFSINVNETSVTITNVSDRTRDLAVSILSLKPFILQ